MMVYVFAAIKKYVLNYVPAVQQIDGKKSLQDGDRKVTHVAHNKHVVCNY